MTKNVLRHNGVRLFIVSLTIAVGGLNRLHRASAGEAPAQAPNILFILADDFGLDGVGCYGSDSHKTPNIDKLAATGTRFETCYSAPLCGPSRCLLMTGRYAFRTGGILNQSWRPQGPGAKSQDEAPIASLLKQSGYVTGMAGKWRQVGETPRAWGFDEYITDPTASGWFWRTTHQKNGEEYTAPDGSYAPDVMHQFSLDFLRRHQGERFFFYYSSHLVHGPIQRTPDTAARGTGKLYEDNIAYLDKQVGELVAELERLGLREKTLVIFSGDNGTALSYPSTVGGRMINGKKGSMWEGGSRVPFIASWPGTTPAGKVSTDIISFADPHATFVELAGAKLPTHLAFDGRSFASQLRGQTGQPRDWAYVQLGKRWYVRERQYKLNEQGELFAMQDAPFVEKLIAPEDDTAASKAARTRLAQVLADLNPAGGKTDTAPAQAGGKMAKANAQNKTPAQGQGKNAGKGKNKRKSAAQLEKGTERSNKPSEPPREPSKS